jgi:hypothetical protein
MTVSDCQLLEEDYTTWRHSSSSQQSQLSCYFLAYGILMEPG